MKDGILDEMDGILDEMDDILDEMDGLLRVKRICRVGQG